MPHGRSNYDASGTDNVFKLTDNGSMMNRNVSDTLGTQFGIWKERLLSRKTIKNTMAELRRMKMKSKSLG